MLVSINFIFILPFLALEVACKGDRAVLIHHIFGNVFSYTTQDWEDSFDLASKTGIDAFVFNVGADSWMEKQLDVAFSVATKYSTKIVFSFDFAVAPWNTASVIAILKRYASQPGHFKYEGDKGGGKSLVSTFDGPARTNVDWVAVKAAVPNIYVVPHLSPDEVKANPPGIDGSFNWNAWATKNNLPIDGNSTTVDDHVMQNALGSSKAYGTLVSPTSFTNYHADGINKQWYFKSENLLVTRWNQMLKFADTAGAHIDLVELYSFNDWGESNYMSNISKALSNEFSGGAEAWCKGFKHDGWLQLNVPFIKAFKSYQSSVTTAHIDPEMVVFDHRPYPAKTLCTGQTQPIPGAEFAKDQVTIVSTLTSPVQLVVKSGTVTTQLQAPAGVFTNSVTMQLGVQSVAVMRNGKQCGEVASSVEVKNSCTTPNFNSNVETIIVRC